MTDFQKQCCNGFKTNEECALALFLYLKTVGKIKGTEYEKETIIHDINNLRGYEWLQHIDRNEETERFFSYLKLGEDRVEPRLAALIEKVAQEVVAQYDWTMPKYNSDEYDNYDDYESDCLDLGHERRGEIYGTVIKRLIEDGKIPEGDESYYEVIDETVWDEITTYICRNQDTVEEKVMQKVWKSPYFAPDSYFLYINNSENKSVSVSKSGNCYVLRGTKPDDYELFEGKGNHPINLGLICEMTLEEALSKAEAIYIRELKELINKKNSLLEVLENGEREIVSEKRENL